MHSALGATLANTHRRCSAWPLRNRMNRQRRRLQWKKQTSESQWTVRKALKKLCCQIDLPSTFLNETESDRVRRGFKSLTHAYLKWQKNYKCHNHRVTHRYNALRTYPTQRSSKGQRIEACFDRSGCLCLLTRVELRYTTSRCFEVIPLIITILYSIFNISQYFNNLIACLM